MYLISQIWGFMALAAVLGFLIGVWVARRRTDDSAHSAFAGASIADAPMADAPIAGEPGSSESPFFRPLARPPGVLPFATAAPSQPSAPAVSTLTPPAPAPSAEAAVTNATFTPSPLAAMSAQDLEAAVLAAGAGVKPPALRAAAGGTPDDLKEIGGVGPTNEAWLHAQGIYHFWQIATLDAPGLAWLANALPTFGKRVYRENWVDQATRLARGEMTDAKQKYLRGEQT